MSNWFGTPKRGASRISPKDVRIIRGGQRFTASYHIDDGQLHVWSAWGSRTEPVGRTKDFKARAEVLLGEIVDGR